MMMNLLIIWLVTYESLLWIVQAVASGGKSKRQCGACTELASALPTCVFHAGSSVYNASLRSYYAEQEQEVKPICVVQPNDTHDVSAAVKILSDWFLLDNNTQFAVRSGGHTPFPGSANIQNGVTFDMSKLNEVTVSADQTSTKIGTGARWGDVYSTLDPMSLGVSGGRVSPVGVGGLILGGGISFFSPKLGFVCDSIINFEIVLADGIITNANATFNSDLWRALRGGSNNFGVVTFFTATTFPLGLLWGGGTTHDISTVGTNLQALADFNTLSYDDLASLIMVFAYSNTNGTISNSVANHFTYMKPIEDPPAFQQFADIPALDSTLRLDTLGNLTDEIAQSSAYGTRQSQLSVTYKSSFALLKRTYELFNASIPTISSVTDVSYDIEFEPIPVQFIDHSTSSGGNVLGLENTTEPLMLVLIQASWASESDDELAVGTLIQLAKDIQEAAEMEGSAHSFIFLNYADITQDPIAGYGAENVAFLRDTSRKYDPSGLFQQAVPGGFKLF